MKIFSISASNSFPFNDSNSHSLSQFEFKVCHLSINSQTNKSDELLVTLRSLEYPDDVCLAETWFDDNETSDFHRISENLGDYFSRKSRLGGGVAIFIKNSAHYNCSITGKEQSVERAFIKIKFKIVVFIELRLQNPQILFTSLKVS